MLINENPQEPMRSKRKHQVILSRKQHGASRKSDYFSATNINALNSIW
jgi:hypothetical protein